MEIETVIRELRRIEDELRFESLYMQKLEKRNDADIVAEAINYLKKLFQLGE